MEDSELTEAEEKEVKEDSDEVKEAERSSTEVEQLKSDLEAQTKIAEDYLSRLKYLQADFENYKKMAARERDLYELCATEGLIKALLPVIDNLEAAIASAKQNEDDTSFVEGLELIYTNLLEVLGKEGLKPIQAVGEAFDPYKHEVLLTVTDDELPEDTVVDEFEKGYTFGSKVIRSSKVKVSKVESLSQTEEGEDA